MKKESIKIELTGRVTNDSWGGEASGASQCQYLHCNETRDTHDFLEILTEKFKDKQIKITIETV